MLHILTILVPTDFSDTAAQALQVACSLARDHHAKLVLMSAPLPPPPSAEVAVPYETYAELLEEPQRQLTALANAIVDLPVEKTRVLVGSPGPAIIEIAKACEADLIVMGTHGRSGLSRLIMGSVAEYVLRHAPCPVLTIKPGTVEHLSHEEKTSLAMSESA
jgi:nucleotide-binding universal stress UspA family protein